MSVDSENPEDDLIFDDDEFLADEPDADKDKFAFGDAEGEGGEAPGGDDLGQVFDEDRPVPQAQSTDWEGDAENENLFADQSVEGWNDRRHGLSPHGNQSYFNQTWIQIIQ